MAFLRRIHTLKSPSPSLSLLHLHRHLSSTSICAAADHPSSTFPSFNSKQAMPNPPLLFTPSSAMSLLFHLRRSHTFSTPSSSSSSLLHHHHRLLSTSNSGGGDDPNTNHPSPSLLRELKEAVKQLSVRDFIIVTPFRDNCSPLPFPAFATTDFDPEQHVLRDTNPTSSTTFSLDDKLQQLRASALSLKQRQDTDCQRLSESIESKGAFMEDIMEDLHEFLNSRRSRTIVLPLREISGNEIDSLITRLTRLNEMAVENIQLAEVLINSRLTSLYQIVQNLYDIRKDLQDDEVWKELNEGLMRGKEIELKDFKLLAEETNLQLVFFQQRITNLFKIRDNQG